MTAPEAATTPEATSFCTSCGAPFPASGNYCAKCGHARVAINIVETPAIKSPPKFRAVPAVLAGLAAVFGAVLGLTLIAGAGVAFLAAIAALVGVALFVGRAGDAAWFRFWVTSAASVFVAALGFAASPGDPAASDLSFIGTLVIVGVVLGAVALILSLGRRLTK